MAQGRSRLRILEALLQLLAVVVMMVFGKMREREIGRYLKRTVLAEMRDQGLSGGPLR